MKIVEVKNIFFDEVGKELIKRGFKHIHTKGTYELVEGDFKFIVTAYFIKWSDRCSHLKLSVDIRYLPCEKTIKRGTGCNNKFILLGDLQQTADLLSLPFEGNTGWDFVYNKEDATLKFKQCLAYIQTIAVPFWKKTQNVNFLYNYARSYINKPNLLLLSSLNKLLNIVCLAFLTNQTQAEFEKLLIECYQHPTLKNERAKMIFDKLVTYIKEMKGVS